MLNNTVRRCLAAGALAISASLSAGTAWGERFITVWTVDPINEHGQLYTDADYTYGIAKGDKLVVEYWEWDGNQHSKNDGCSFTLEVGVHSGVASVNGVAVGHQSDLEVTQFASNINDAATVYKLKMKGGCNPNNTSPARSHFLVYGDQSYEPEEHHPLIVTRLEVQGNHDDSSRKGTVTFNYAPAAAYGLGKPHSVTDACLEDPYIVSWGRDSEFVRNAMNVNQMHEDGDRTIKHYVFYNELKYENMLIIREANEGGDVVDGPFGDPPYNIVDIHNDNGTDMTFCDGGSWPEKNWRINWPDGHLNGRLATMPGLPSYNSNNVNAWGEGVSSAGLNNGTYANDEDRLSILTWNVGSIPEVPDDKLHFGHCAYFNSNCARNWRERRRKLREMAKSLRGAQPDILVLVEAFQDKASFLNKSRWNQTKARRELREALGDLYDWASVTPKTIPSAYDTYRPENCDTSSTSFRPDVEIYPDAQNTWLTVDEYCNRSKGTGLDSGVLIGVRKGSGSNTLSIVSGEGNTSGEYWTKYDHSAGGEGAGAKGIRYLHVRKQNGNSSEDYHIFGTHLQSSKSNCYARVEQIAELSTFISSRGLDRDDRIILTGDLNIDPWRNNHGSTNVEETDGVVTVKSRAQGCRNELEYLVRRIQKDFESSVSSGENGQLVGRVPLTVDSMPFTNDCVNNALVGHPADTINCGTAVAPGDKSKILDHTLWIGQKPVSMGATITRQVALEENGTFPDGLDLSGHYPTISVLDYETELNSNFILDSAYTFPMMCPFGTPSGVLGDASYTFASDEDIDGSIDLACVPVDCTSSDSSDRCDPLAIAGSGSDRKYCLSGDENWTAPCIVQPGYQNLAAATGVTTLASDEVAPNISVDNHTSDRVINGRVLHSTDTTTYHGGYHWIALAHENAWVKVKLPVAQYVKRVRFKNGGGGRETNDNYAAKTYSLFYNDVAKHENNDCSSDVADSIPTTHGSPDVDCSRIFADADSKDAELMSASTPTDIVPDPDIWHVHETDSPVLTDTIVFLCEESTGSRCAIDEIEIYGGAE